jgi:Nucleotidyltransferase domain
MSLSIPDDLLRELIAELDDEHTTVIALDGSYARGEAGPYSDVDIVCYRDDMRDDEPVRHWFQYRAGFLFSIHCIAIAAERAGMYRMPQAIWSVGGLRNYRPLLDKRGELAALLQEARDFQWSPLQLAAAEYASEQLARYCEFALKIMAGLTNHDLNNLHRNIPYMAGGEMEIIAVQHGLMIASDNDLLRQVTTALGEGSAWLHYYRLTTGLDYQPSSLPLLEAQGIAALRLHLETTALLRPILRASEREVIEVIEGRVKELLGKIEGIR